MTLLRRVKYFVILSDVVILSFNALHVDLETYMLLGKMVFQSNTYIPIIHPFFQSFLHFYPEQAISINILLRKSRSVHFKSFNQKVEHRYFYIFKQHRKQVFVWRKLF